jgi:hypothetical protein
MVDIRHLLELKLVYSGINFFKRSNKHMNGSLRQIVHTSLFTALIIVGGYLSLPLPFTQIPVVLADFFILLAGLTLGAAGGGMAVALFILLGALGKPAGAFCSVRPAGLSWGIYWRRWWPVGLRIKERFPG